VLWKEQSKLFNAVEIFWVSTGFLFVLNGCEIQGYSLFCPSAFPEKYHHRMQKYRSESARQHILLSLYQNTVVMLGFGVKKRSRMKRSQLELLRTAEKRAFTQVPKYGLGA